MFRDPTIRERLELDGVLPIGEKVIVVEAAAPSFSRRLKLRGMVTTIRQTAQQRRIRDVVAKKRAGLRIRRDGTGGKRRAPESPLLVVEIAHR